VRRPSSLVRRRAAAPRDAEVSVRATSLHVRLGGAPILTAVDLAVTGGELVGLVGPNGAGKSTLLAALAGDVSPDAGRVEVAGRPAAAWPARDLARHRAVLPQRAEVRFPFTAAEVVAMGRAPWVGTEAERHDEDVVAEAMEATDVVHLAERREPTLSGGERARVALARVLAQQTPVLLLDEPTAALDLHHQQLVLRLARAHADAGGAVVVVLHDLGLAAAHADRLVVLEAGRMVADGAPDAVLDPDLLSRVYAHPIDVLPHPRTGAPLVLPR
jgi:iron complex transport system ATP-binding protein